MPNFVRTRPASGSRRDPNPWEAVLGTCRVRSGFSPLYVPAAFLANLPFIDTMVGDIAVYASGDGRPLKAPEELHGQPCLSQGRPFNRR